MEDRQTTPPRWRLPALILLAATLLYLMGGYRMALTELGYANRPGAFSERVIPWFWAAQFHMFNEPRPTVSVVHATVTQEGGAVTVDLPALYPTLREEGPSYARSRFLRDPQRLALMGQDLCRKVGGRSVHLWLEKRAKIASVQPETVELGNWPCGGPP